MASEHRPKHGAGIPWSSVALAAAAIAIVAIGLLQTQREDPKHTQRNQPATHTETRARKPETTTAKVDPHPRNKPAPARTGGYEWYRSCTLADHPHNDGDSFAVRLPGGRTEQFRLYFVDAPESAFKRYRNGEDNHTRIREQGEDLGGISPAQAIEIGRRAKARTLSLLRESPFDLFTSWDSPFGDGRYHAFVRTGRPDPNRWLHEQLVEEGLVRIHTKPAPLPDGTPAAAHRGSLRSLESTARREQRGAWGL
jgi:endonuclease YncB( thermonuclease family)